MRAARIRRSLLAALALTTAVATPAPAATVTIENFAPSGGAEPGQPYGARALKLDVDGNGVDAHAGAIRFYEGRFHRYGEHYDCPFTFDSAGQLVDPNTRNPPPCGFRSYSSPDLVRWRDEGPMLPGLRERAQDEQDLVGGGNGYFSTTVVRDEQRDRYVMWFNVVRRPGDGRPSYYTAVSSRPNGPFEDVRVAPLESPQGGDFDVFVDQDGSAYIVHVVTSPPFSLRLQPLAGDLRSGTGEETVITMNSPDPDCPDRIGCPSGTKEAPALFRRGERYYLMTGEACAFCWASAGYFIAPSPTGPWTGATGLPSTVDKTIKAHPASCGGQPRRVDVIPGARGPVHLFQSDLWNSDEVNAGSGGFGYPQQGLAGYFWYPLEFTADGLIAPIRCSEEVHLDLATPAPPPRRRDRRIDADPGRRGLRAKCVAQPGETASQLVRVRRRGQLVDVTFPLFRYGDPDGPVVVSLERLRERRTRVLARHELAPDAVPYAPRVRRIAPVAGLRRGDALVVRLAHRGTRGCYGTAVSARDVLRRGRATTSAGGVADLAVRTRIAARPKRRARH